MKWRKCPGISTVLMVALLDILWITYTQAADRDNEDTTFELDGTAYITYEPPDDLITQNFHMRFRFRAKTTYGILLHAVLDTNREMTVRLENHQLVWYYKTGQESLPREVATAALDRDSEWHDVHMTYEGTTARLTVDGATGNTTTVKNMGFYGKVFIGAAALDSKMQNTSEQFFMGCLQDLTLNNRSIFEVKPDHARPVKVHGVVHQGCKLPVHHVTFSGDDSYVRINSERKGDDSVYSASFDFRTYDVNATLLFVDMDHAGNITVDLEENRHILAIFMDGNSVVRILYELYTGSVIVPGDGQWHSFTFELNNLTGLVMALDQWVIVDEKIKAPLNNSVRTFYLGGIPDSFGFNGCMKNIVIDEKGIDLSRLEDEDVVQATLGKCDLSDRCTNTSCSHGGRCHQTRLGFDCDCAGTGYTGAICHTPQYQQSCDLIKFPPNKITIETAIDVDGSGPLRPLPVVCKKVVSRGIMQTSMYPVATNNSLVDGFQQPGSFVGDIKYYTGLTEIMAAIDRSDACRQFIEYNCTGSRLLSKPGENAPSYAWWVGRNNVNHYYWGGAKAGSGGCACATSQGGCVGKGSCNCDAGLKTGTSDGGFLSQKDLLPVTQLRFGDTGTLDDEKFGRYHVGPVNCRGNKIAANTVTFNRLGATISLPLVFRETPSDVWFQFKTGIRRAYLIHSRGDTDKNDGKIVNALSIRLSGSFSLVVDLTMNKRRTIFKQDVSFHLNDNKWHSVYFELSVKEATVKVDDEKAIVWKADTWTGKMVFTTNSPFIVGNSLEGEHGFLGCLRGLMLNGETIDLVTSVKNKQISHGVQEGCQGKCDSLSNPCLNEGQCQDYYATYMCDCTPSAFTGCYCGLDLGAYIKINGGIMYRLDQRLSERERDFKVLKFGFKTQRNLGVLVHITNAHPGFPDFISIEMGSTGGIQMFIDVGHGEAVIYSSAGKTDDGKIHYVTLTYNNTREEVVLQVDDFTDTFNLTRLPTGVDTTLDAPKRMFIGRLARTVPGAGFEGCIFRLLYNDHPVLQDVFLNPTPRHVFLVGQGKIKRSTCGMKENVPRSIRHLHSPKPLTLPDELEHALLPPLVTNITVRTSISRQGEIGKRHVMSGFQEITCSASGVPSPTYKWRKNGGQLSCPHLALGDKLIMIEDDRLDGSYQCVARNIYGRASSDNVFIQAPRITRLQSIRYHKLVIREGGFLRLECNEHVESVPTTNTTWTFNGHDEKNDRIFLSPTGALNILPVLKKDSGVNYTCLKTNPMLDVSIVVKIIYLTVITVTDYGKLSELPTKLVYQTPPPTTAFVGGSMYLECVLSGGTANEMRWHREDSKQDPSVATLRWRVSNKGRQLNIINITEEDQGWYLCSNIKATFARFYLDVTSGPIWVEKFGPLTVYRGGNASLSCLTRSAPGEKRPRKPKWFRNGRRIVGDNRHILSENRTKLTIQNVTKKEDTQTIQCNVSNHRGYTYAETFLTIVEPLRVTKQPTDVAVDKGNLASLFVEVSIDPTLDVKFTWLKTEQHIRQMKTKHSDPRKVFSVTATHNSSTLTLNTKYIADVDVVSFTGYYVCVIADGIGKQTSIGKIVIQMPQPTIPYEDDSSLLVGMALAISLGIVFIIVIVAIFFITRKRRNNQGEEVAELPLKSSS